MWHQRFLRYVVVWLAGAGMLFTSLGLVTLVIAHELGATPAQIGLTFTITGAGGLAGALAAPALLRRTSPAAVVISYAWIATAATFALLLVDSVWVLGLIGAAAFFPVPTLNALVMSEVAQRAPEAILGRANSATVQLLTLLHPLSPVLAGLALEILGTPTTLVSYGVALAVLAVLVTTSPTVRAGPPD